MCWVIHLNGKKREYAEDTKQRYISLFSLNHILDPVSSTNKTDRHDITEILLKVDLNTITLILSHMHKYREYTPT